MNAYRSQSRRTQLLALTVAAAVTLGLLDIVCGSMLFPSRDATAQRVEVLAAQASRASELRALATPVQVASSGNVTH